jgi:hypothetical protein
MKPTSLIPRICTTLSLTVIAFLSSTVEAQTLNGAITSINHGRTSVNAKLGETLLVAVDGKGNCQSILFSPGDSPMTMILPNKALPMEVKHRYEKVGKFKLKVSAGSPDCDGKGEITVIVK